MFAQVIQAKAKDAAGVRKQFERWGEELRPRAEGFLGSTAGVSPDGEFIALVRFENEDVARANSDRPEQGQWWSETEQYLEEVRFYDSSDITTLGDGGSDEAGFVQVIQGTVRDRNAYEQMGREWEPQMRQQRPDVIGGVVVWQDNDFTQVMYFTSEDAAREGERNMEQQADSGSSGWEDMVTNMKFIDLTEPWMQ